MRVLVFDGRFTEPRVVDIKGDLKSMQEVVGGDIEFTPFADGIDFVCNDESKLLDMPINRYLFNAGYDENNGIYDCINGVFFACGVDNNTGESKSLTDEQITHIKYCDYLCSVILTEWH